MTDHVLLDIGGMREGSDEVVDQSRTEMFTSPNNFSTETTTTGGIGLHMSNQRGFMITSAADTIAHTVEKDLVITTEPIVATSPPFSEESSSKLIQITTPNEAPIITHVIQHEATSEATHVTTHITEADIIISTEQSSLPPATSSAPSTSEPTIPHTTHQQPTSMTSETSRPIETTTTTTSMAMTSSVGSSVGSTERVTTAVHDVTTITHKRTSTDYRPTSMTSVNNTTDLSTKHHPYPHLTSVETNVDNGLNSTVGSPITLAPQQLPLTYIIIGAVSLAVLFLVFMCIVIVCICRKRQRKNSGLDDFDYSFDLRARSRRTLNGPARVSYSFTQRSYSNNSFADIPGADSGLGNASTLGVPVESNMKKAHSNSDNLLTRYNLEPNMYISDEPDSPEANGLASPVTGNVRSNSDSKFDRNDSVMYSTFKRAPKGVELAEGFQGELLV